MKQSSRETAREMIMNVVPWFILAQPLTPLDTDYGSYVRFEVCLSETAASTSWGFFLWMSF